MDQQIHPAMHSAVDFTAGTMGGIVTVFVGQPMDTIKVKMQTFPELYRNPLSCFSTTLRVEGVRHGLYAGTLPAIAANVAENSILFMCYGTIQRLIMTSVGKTHDTQLTTVENGMAGFFAAFFSSLTLCPTELVKCRLQAIREIRGCSKKTGHIGVYSICRDIFKTEGFRGFYHGLVPTFWREMPGYFFFFAAYDFSRRSFKKWLDVESKDDIGAFATIISGGIGGSALWAAIFPADVIKSRMQIMTMSKPAGTTLHQGMMDIGISILQKEGPRGLYCGLVPSLLRSFPATGALFFAYELTKKSLQSLCYPE